MKTLKKLSSLFVLAATVANANLPDGFLPGGSATPTPPPAHASKLYNLRWNPEISSFTEETFREGFRLLNRRDSTGLGFNWSIHDPEELRAGDWCVFTRVGSNNVNGVVGIGRFTTRAYEGDSWRRDGSRISYADLEILCFQEPAETGLWTADELERAIPGEDWRQGHAGVVIEGDAAEELAKLLVKGLADIRRPHTKTFAVRHHPGGARSVANGLLSHLCPRLLAGLERCGTGTAGEAYWPEAEPGDRIRADFGKLRAGKGVEESIELLEWSAPGERR